MYLRNGIVMLDKICKNKKTSSQKLYGRPIVTRTLCNEAKFDTKIQINPNVAKQNLYNLKINLSKNPQRLNSLSMLNTDICRALGIENQMASHYGGFNIDGFECSIRVSNHNSNANTYEINLNNNISLKIRPKGSKNSFIPSSNVTLEEFTYFDYMIQQDKDLVLDIIDSLIGYLTTGEYVDESGLAKKNYSPDSQTISRQRVQQTLQRKDNEDFINRWHMGENKNYNINNTMKKKKVIRLTESDLHNMIAEGVRQALNELDPRTYASAAEKRRLQGKKENAKSLMKAATNAWNNEFSDENTRLIPDFSNDYYDYEYPIEYTIQSQENFDDDSCLTHNYTPYIQSHPVFDDSAISSRFPGRGKTWEKKIPPYKAPKSSRKDILGYDPFGSSEDAHQATEKFINKNVNAKGIKVVKDMNKRNGKYIKDKGWQ